MNIEQNRLAVIYLNSLANEVKEADNTWTRGVLFGACQALAMAGIITADQWNEAKGGKASKTAAFDFGTIPHGISADS